MARILVLGGGFGGLEAAHRLKASLPPEHEITVVDGRDRFLPGLAKLWDIVGIASAEDNSRPRARLRDRGIGFVHTEITAIDPGARSVETRGGRIDADFLIIALGASFSPVHTAMLEATGHNLYEASSGAEIRRALLSLEGGRIVIVVMGVPYKCPPAPYEAAFLIDDWLREHGRRDDVAIAVYTPQPSPLPIAGPEASRRIASTLAERDIELHTGHHIELVERDPGEIRFKDAGATTFSLLLGVPKHVVPPVLADSGLVGESGWLEPDRATLTTFFERVYAVGDCTAIPIAAGFLPKAGVFAEAQARVVAANIAAELTGGERTTFDGHGYCFLELPGRMAAYVRGNFYAQPKPDVVVSEPSDETFRAKGEFARNRLETWL